MATENLFNREPDPGLLKELKARSEGTIKRRLKLFGDRTTPGNMIYAHIVTHINPATGDFRYSGQNVGRGGVAFGGQVLMGLGDTLLLQEALEANTTFHNATPYTNPGSIGRKKLKYACDSIEVMDAGKFGTLRSLKFSFKLGGIMKGRYTRADYDKDFAYIENELALGRYIAVRYGYKDRDSGSSEYQKSAETTKYVNSYILKTKNYRKRKIIDDTVMFRIMKPEYSIGDDGVVKFTIEAIGQGNEIFETDINRKFNYKGIPLLQNLTEAPTFTTDHDSGIESTVTNMIDYLDWEVQTALELKPGAWFGSDFDIYNGYSSVWRPPPKIHALSGWTPADGATPSDKSKAPGIYDNAGWVIFRWYEDYYANRYAIEDDDSTYHHTVYCSLQWIAWYFNCILNDNGAGLKNMSAQPAKGSTAPFVIRCDGATTKGTYYIDIPMKNQTNAATVPGSALKRIPIPSANPYECIFNYGTNPEIPGQQRQVGRSYAFGPATSDYIPLHELWATNIYRLSVLQAGYDRQNERGIFFTVPPYDGDTVVSDDSLFGKGPLVNKKTVGRYPGAPGKQGRGVTNNALNMAKNQYHSSHGDLSKILFNRDVLAAILDELGGLTTAQDAKSGGDISKVTLQTFWNKLFDIVKSNSGGAYDLEMIVDPDQNPSSKLTQMLIRNKNESNKQKVKYPTFNKGDGSTLSLNLKSTIPKSAMAAVFQDQNEGPPSSGGNTYGMQDPEADDADITDDAKTASTGIPSLEELLYIKHDMVFSSFNSESCDAMRGLLKRALESNTKQGQIANWQNMFPLKLSLKILGIQGFRFGDTIMTNMLPPKYLNPIGKARICFTVLKVIHNFGESGWTTTLETQCRVVPFYVMGDDPNNVLESSLDN
jgi:hypothetical protein